MSLPILLTVDDDPSVSRAVARDLRRRYGRDYRVMRATSGADALEALREVKLRGDAVAAILADYRMPQMNGIEFLEQAMDLFPRARRALLTAYADTEAAIQAINVVDVDHYLLKPWDPPEEKLYPVVDTLVQSWQETPDRPVNEIKVVGHRWSPRSYKVRDFLVRNAVPYRWYSVEEPDGLRLLDAAEAGPDDIPVVIPPNGRALVRPTGAEIASAAGLSTDPAQDLYDLVVVGGGPAGLGASVYGASEGLRTLLVEKRAIGGQAGTSSKIENYLGFPDGVSGAQLTGRARRQARKFGTEILTARRVVRLEARGSARILTLDDDTEVTAHAVVLAIGVMYRVLDAEGCDELTGRGIYYGSTFIEADAIQDEDIYIIGGANSAGQAAVFLSRRARSVTLVVRGKELRQSMSHYLIEEIRSIDNINVRLRTTVVGAHGDEHLEELTLCEQDGGQTERVPCRHAFVFIGATPHTEWLGDTVKRDQHGFICTGSSLLVEGARPPGWTPDRDPFYLESSIPGVFAAGDVRSQSVRRVASAVGEGAMAVALVHRYLEER
ncbi:fused response regulator/thioredoxin-disulfide reductase [Actinomadura sp. NBRC 104412]|uniref:FAD-dependent oxidoreductase n=1 Tax=Actinomadura sp. NBRC 104412 TaxID=3032203 RepID=UPI0024A14B66|nr:FAD-dependent oxidoreductase [Actinomadura sp. NBRC 104412]GLZ08487.1 fused response regulator/thioredoxin-disulfide reductase [Actinomadura sp. NBRC 104412]